LSAESVTKSCPNLLAWLFGLALVMLVVAIGVRLGLTIPIHATFGHPLLRGLFWSAVGQLAAAVVLLGVSIALDRFHVMVGRGVRWMAGVLVAAAIHAVALALLAEALNVRFDTSPPVRVTTGLVDTPLDVKAGRTIQIADWQQDGGEPLRAKFDPRLFQLEADGPTATFYWREGWLGLPYACEALLAKDQPLK
jgi:hypothetical protein